MDESDSWCSAETTVSSRTSMLGRPARGPLDGDRSDWPEHCNRRGLLAALDVVTGRSKPARTPDGDGLSRRLGAARYSTSTATAASTSTSRRWAPARCTRISSSSYRLAARLRAAARPRSQQLEDARSPPHRSTPAASPSPDGLPGINLRVDTGALTRKRPVSWSATASAAAIRCPPTCSICSMEELFTRQGHELRRRDPRRPSAMASPRPQCCLSGRTWQSSASSTRSAPARRPADVVRRSGARSGGNDFVVWNTQFQGSTLMHELGPRSRPAARGPTRTTASRTT